MAIVAVGANKSMGDGGRTFGMGPTWQSPDRPAPAIRAEPRDRGSRGLSGGAGNVLVNDQPEEPVPTTTKPPYAAPSMAEIRKIPWNGYRVASTFSGCGGSSLGYRMAGFRVVYANEFVPAAQETYRANGSPYTYLDPRDIRTITPESLMEHAGVGVGELDLLDGSPPCASFSTSGKRHAGWGKVKKYSDTNQRTDDLFYEFARILRGVQPKVFVAENVSGLVKGTAKGYFIRIMAELRAAGYLVEARLLDAQWLGVPQARQRLIFVGVRSDLGRPPAFPRPLPYRYSVREVLGGGIAHKSPNRYDGSFVEHDGSEPAPTIMAHGIGGVHQRQALRTPEPTYRFDNSGAVRDKGMTDGPSPMITVGVHSVNSHHYQVSDGGIITHDPETGKDLRIGSFAIGREYARLREGEGSDRYTNLTRSHRDRPSPTVTATAGQVAAAGVTHPTVARKFTLGELRRLCGFPDDFELRGTYEQRWERLGRAVPPVMMSHIAASVRDRVLTPQAERDARGREPR